MIDARSDLFSLCSLLYALATGRPPFRANTPLGVLRKVTEATPKPISQINERVPPWLDRLVSQLMQVDVVRRIGSAESAAVLLRPAHAHVNNPSVNPLPTALSVAGAARRVRLAVGTIAFVVLAILGLRSAQTDPHPKFES